MEQNKIISPCISVCKTDPISGYCYGCARTDEEKKIWKDENTTNEWKENNLTELKDRLSDWQLDAFELLFPVCLSYLKPLKSLRIN